MNFISVWPTVQFYVLLEVHFTVFYEPSIINHKQNNEVNYKLNMFQYSSEC